ncbi:hypothetical protein C8Q78DRAFT_995382 [Trametes maxima]|nr:hypothetical protein C8Q78DRAFT_995382 [Trametes maxima]
MPSLEPAGTTHTGRVSQDQDVEDAQAALDNASRLGPQSRIGQLEEGFVRNVHKAGDVAGSDGFGLLLDGLNTLVESLPPLVLVGAFKVVIELEVKRRDNDKKIHLLFLEMRNMMAALLQLDGLRKDHEGRDGITVEARLTDLVNKTAREIKACANACDAYARKWLLAKGVDSVNAKLDVLTTKMEVVFEFFRKAVPREERVLAEAIRQGGGAKAVLANLSVLQELLLKEARLEAVGLSQTESGPPGLSAATLGSTPYLPMTSRSGETQRSRGPMSSRPLRGNPVYGSTHPPGIPTGYDMYTLAYYRMDGSQSGRRAGIPEEAGSREEDGNYGVARLMRDLADEPEVTIKKNSVWFEPKFEIQRQEMVAELTRVIERQGDRMIRSVPGGPHERIVDTLRVSAHSNNLTGLFAQRRLLVHTEMSVYACGMMSLWKGSMNHSAFPDEGEVDAEVAHDCENHESTEKILKYPAHLDTFYPESEDGIKSYCVETSCARCRTFRSLGHWAGFQVHSSAEGLVNRNTFTLDFHPSPDDPAKVVAVPLLDMPWMCTRATVTAKFASTDDKGNRTYVVTKSYNTSTLQGWGFKVTLSDDSLTLGGEQDGSISPMASLTESYLVLKRDLTPEIMVFYPTPSALRTNMAAARWRFAISAVLDDVRRHQCFSWAFIKERRDRKQLFASLLLVQRQRRSGSHQELYGSRGHTLLRVRKRRASQVPLDITVVYGVQEAAEDG